MNSLRISAVLVFLCCPVFAQSHELSLSGGYNYQNSDQGDGIRANLHGWFASAQFDLTSMVSLTAEVDNYYGQAQRQGTTQQNFIAGPQFTFGSEKAKIRPFVYVQVGDQRSASDRNVENAFNLQLGGGVQVKLSDNLSLQFTPAEYSMATPNESPTHSYSAKVGISWTIWKQKGSRE
jgi:opacity protein-like surface antigen